MQFMVVRVVIFFDRVLFRFEMDVIEFTNIRMIMHIQKLCILMDMFAVALAHHKA